MESSRRRFLRKWRASPRWDLGTQPVIQAVASSPAQHGPQTTRCTKAPRRTQGQTVGHGDRYPKIAARRKDIEPLIKACHKVHNIPTAI